MRRTPRILLSAATLVSLVLCVGVLLSTIPLVAGAFGGMDKAIASGRQTIPPVRQFDHLFPGANHSISYYTGTAGTPTWVARTTLYRRYILTMEVPITLSTFGRSRVVAHGPPRFLLVEVETVGQSAGGSPEIRYGALQLRFGPAEWEQIVAGGGDCGVLGITMRKDEPVPGFDKVWKHE